ncbi:MAG TPA: CAAX prenyl protease-related protein [Usitatibacter sp.]
MGPALARVAPFAVFIAFLALQPVVDGVVDPRWWVAWRGIAAALVLLLFARSYTELALPPALRECFIAIAVGWIVFAAWIAFDSGWATIGSVPSGFDPRRPDGSIDTALVAARVFGLALAVPVMEELFWRSFLMRWIDRRDFLAKDPRAASMLAFGLSCALFASEHSMWFAGLIAGAAYAGLYMRTRNLWIPILSHATTNGTLATWILATGNWHLW